MLEEVLRTRLGLVLSGIVVAIIVAMGDTDTDQDFWDVGDEDGPRPARRRRGGRRSSGFPESTTKAGVDDSAPSNKKEISIVTDKEVGTPGTLATDAAEQTTSADAVNDPPEQNATDSNEGIYESSFESDQENTIDENVNRDEETENEPDANNPAETKMERYGVKKSSVADDRRAVDVNEDRDVSDEDDEEDDEPASIGCSSEESEAGLEERSKPDNLYCLEERNRRRSRDQQVGSSSNVEPTSNHEECRQDAKINLQVDNTQLERNRTLSQADPESMTGNLRPEVGGGRRPNKLKWGNNSSTDIRTGSSLRSSLDLLVGPDQLLRASEQNDVGYPPKARLKNALWRGRRHLVLKDGDGAVEEFVRSYALARIVHGDHHWRTCRTRLFLAQAYLYLKEFFCQAETEAKAAREVLGKNYGTPWVPRKKLQVRHLLVLAPLLEGEARLMQEHFEEAVAPLNRAESQAKVFERKMSRNRRELPASLRQVRPVDLRLHVLRVQADLASKRKRPHQAREKLEEALRYAEQQEGPENPRLVPVLQQFGEHLSIYPVEQAPDAIQTEATPATAKTETSSKLNAVDNCDSKMGVEQEKACVENRTVSNSGETIESSSTDEREGDDDKDDVTRGIAMLTRAVQICKLKYRPGSEAELDARVLLIRHQVVHRRAPASEALRELHRLYTVVSRARGDHTPPAISLQGLTVQVLLQQEEYDLATKELHKMLKCTRRLHGEFSKQACNVLRQLWHVRAAARDIPGLAEALSQLLAAEVLVFGVNSQRADTTREKLRETMLRTTVPLRLKLERRHPELQGKPRFRSQ